MRRMRKYTLSPAALKARRAAAQKMRKPPSRTVRLRHDAAAKLQAAAQARQISVSEVIRRDVE